MTYCRTASLAALRQRAAVLARIRAFFAARGVLEVETPYLSSAGVSDLALDSIAARVRSLGALQYLHTSPEYAMKRLLASGSGDIYQICRVFREDELGRWHQPEFTMLEWYRVGWDDIRLMSEVEELLVDVLAPAITRSLRVRYDEALERTLGLTSHAATDRLVSELVARDVDVPRGLAHDAVLDLAFAGVVAPSFPSDALTFVHDYPASQAALARLKPGQRARQWLPRARRCYRAAASFRSGARRSPPQRSRSSAARRGAARRPRAGFAGLLGRRSRRRPPDRARARRPRHRHRAGLHPLPPQNVSGPSTK